MKQKSKRAVPAAADPAGDDRLAPITAMISSRLMVLANLLKRGAIIRYKRLAGLSSVEFGLVASLGRRPPMSVARLAEAVGMDRARSAGRWPGWCRADSWHERSTRGITGRCWSA